MSKSTATLLLTFLIILLSPSDLAFIPISVYLYRTYVIYISYDLCSAIESYARQPVWSMNEEGTEGRKVANSR